MTKLKKRVLLIFAAVVVIAVAFIGGLVFQNKASAGSVQNITSDLIANQIASISEYASLEYRYTNVGKFEDCVDFYGWKIPWATKSFIITYDGAMKLGIQGKDIFIEVHKSEIRIKLPPVQVLSHEIYEDTLEVLDQTKNIFNQIQIEDYTTFATDQKKEMEQKTQENGLFLEANERAEQQIEVFLKSTMDTRDEYTVVFIR